MAAQRATADTDAAHDLCLIADADLTKFDSRLEYGCQILYQLAEVNSPIRCEVKQDLVIVESVLYVHQLHLQLMLADLLLANAKGFLFLLLILSDCLQILFRRDPDHRLQRLHNGFLRNFLVRYHNRTHLQPASRFYNNFPVSADLQRTRIKIVNLSGHPEAYSNNCNHKLLIFLHSSIHHILSLTFK